MAAGAVRAAGAESSLGGSSHAAVWKMLDGYFRTWNDFGLSAVAGERAITASAIINIIYHIRNYTL